MDKKSRIFFIIFFSVIALAIGMAYCKYFIIRDYYIQAEADCDPETENCFVYVCDPESDEECPEAEDERTSYYKLISKKAYLIPSCDPNDEECNALECLPGQDCKEILCDETNVPEGEECNDPEKYIEENGTSDEEDADIEEGDEEEAEEEDGDVEEEVEEIEEESGEMDEETVAGDETGTL